ncbi:phage protein, HK97 gp10 family [Faunimonas pinastri]|uniref:Phage protein, HK97 gp10 family n=1 Tax=Faunimonas pinastri TaxID=1855383 RepID=A0A1H9F758_9HYPH|nr:HK97-gp10 family putative phage morphogenesis protein [Faunimonas pinastri]SEQ33108.1 phage protein, HK97 gp10 family [Faunimonas pinastri]
MAKVRNRERLAKVLQALPARVKEATKAALAQNADELVLLQKRLVVVDKGVLRDSITATELSEEKGYLGYQVQAGGPTTTRPVREGAGVTYDYALAVEFGTEKMAAEPFFYPSYRANKKRFKSRVTRAMRKAIKDGAAGT